jgi:hypothetical protein
MRKIFTLLLMLAIGMQLMAQKGFQPVKRNLDFAQPARALQLNNAVKSPGDVIFSEDFDGADWSATSNNGVPVPENAPANWIITDLNDTGFCWRWDTVGPRGIFTSPGEGCTLPNEPMYSTTQSNGYMMIEADWFNSSEDCSEFTTVAMDSYLQYEGGLDFSNADAVHLVFEQVNRLCCGFGSESDLWFSVSADNGTTWEQLSVPDDLGSGLGRLGQPAEVTELDITNMVAGQSNVWFRFHMQGLSHYYWLIDDVIIFEPEDNDIQFLDYWNDYIEYWQEDGWRSEHDFTEGFFEYPWFLVQEYKGFHAVYYNFGGQPQTNFVHNVEIWKDESLYASFATDPVDNVPVGAQDTTMLMANVWPWYMGDYMFVHYPSMDELDDVTSNDTLIRHMRVSDTALKVVDFAKVNSYISPDNWTSYDEDGDGLGFMLNIPDPYIGNQNRNVDYYLLNGVYVYIASNSGEEIVLFETEVAKLVAGVYKYDTLTDTYTEVISSAERTLTINDTSSVIYVPFATDGTSEYVFEGGTYLIAINMYGTWTDAFGRLQTWNIMNADNTVQKRSRESCVIVNATIEDDNDVGWTGEGPAFALDIEGIGNHYIPYDATFIVKNTNGEFIEGAILESASHGTATTNSEGVALLEDFYYWQSDTIIISASGYEDYYQPINWLWSDTTINITMSFVGIQNSENIEFSIYPNPSNGIFHITCEGEYNMEVADLSGKVVYESKGAGQELVDLTKQPVGMYFVNITQNNQTVTKRLIVK